ncbi:PP2C family serine/threonine-protein phosphatase [Psychrobacillus sp. NPDC093180]|uniref:PP2C family serine/threonine-protein phosphatase n=1 Tax=Psychrobacillus sp. NPDC093180 TaxID=3364489 RepID=UPI00381F86B2
MWKMIGTAVQGRSHLKHDIPVQDKVFHLSDKVNVIALADGAGSAKLSHFGAQTVVETICHALNEHFDYLFALEQITDAQTFIIEQLLDVLHQLADFHNEEVNEFASTLLCVAIKNEKVLIFHLGDGEIGAMKDGELVSISSASNGEYANATYFVTSSQASSRLKIFKSSNSKKFTSYFLLSDGTAASFYSKQQNKFSDIIKKICLQSKFTSETEMNAMLEESFEQFVKQRTSDDCSFVAMTAVNNNENVYISLSEEERKYLLSSFSELKHCSIKKLDSIVFHLAKPLTLKQLGKIMYIKPKYIKQAINLLKSLGIVVLKKQKYHLTFEGTYDEYNK